MAKIDVIFTLMSIAAIIISLVIHECAHTLTASWLGDQSAVNEGRLSLSPSAHLDPLGTALPVVLALLGFVPVGYGVPPKVDAWKLRPGLNSGTTLVAAAGPIANLLVGILIALLIGAGIHNPAFVDTFFNNVYLGRISQFLIIFSVVNFALVIFNFIPVYPLDGYKIVIALLPSRPAIAFRRTESYGPMILFVILFIIPAIFSFARLDSTWVNLVYWIDISAQNLFTLIVPSFGKFDLLRLFMHFHCNVCI